MYTDHFSIGNIPFGIGSSSSHPSRSVVTRFEDTVIFLDELAKFNLLSEVSEPTRISFSNSTVNAFAALPKAEHVITRKSVQSLVQNGGLDKLPLSSISSILATTLHLPLSIGDFTDFSCSLNHVLNAGEAVLGKREAPPGFEHFPVGYTARTSSIVVSGTPIARPKGQYRNEEGKVIFGPTRKMDYELEVAAVIGKASTLGKSVSIENADEYIFGLVLLNDWSARDIQGLEMNPLGPLNGKSFGTAISPWIITLDALAPFKAPPPTRNPSVELATYLQDPEPKPTYEFELSATLKPYKSHFEPKTICSASFSSLYWTLRDLVAHQTINGCPLNVGDLLATGTISGETWESHGCLLELAGKGGVEITSADGLQVERRLFLQDGDTVTLTALAGPGVGFGDCSGEIVSA